MTMRIGDHQIGTVGGLPAMFTDDGHVRVADSMTTLRFVAGVNHHGLGARPESAEFIRACDLEETAGLLVNRSQNKRQMDSWWVTEAGHTALAAS